MMDKTTELTQPTNGTAPVIPPVESEPRESGLTLTEEIDIWNEKRKAYLKLKFSTEADYRLVVHLKNEKREKELFEAIKELNEIIEFIDGEIKALG